MFNVGQRTAVAGAFRLAGYDGELLIAPIASEDERAFLLDPASFAALRERRILEQVVGQILGRKVWIAERTARWPVVTPFE